MVEARVVGATRWWSTVAASRRLALGHWAGGAGQRRAGGRARVSRQWSMAAASRRSMSGALGWWSWATACWRKGSGAWLGEQGRA